MHVCVCVCVYACVCMKKVTLQKYGNSQTARIVDIPRRVDTRTHTHARTHTCIYMTTEEQTQIQLVH